jgi:hypothetical protein
MKKLYLFLIMIFVFSIFYVEDAYAISRGGTKDKTQNVSTTQVMQVKGQNSFSLQTITNGRTEDVVSGSGKSGNKNGSGSSGNGKNGSGNGASSGPACYIWKKSGNWNGVQLGVTPGKNDKMDATITIDGVDYKFNEKTTDTLFKSNSNPVYKNPDLSQEERYEIGQTVNVYVVLRNPAADSEFTPTGRCGVAPFSNGYADIFYSVKPIKGDPDSEETIATAVRNSQIDVDLQETGNGTYTAKVDFGSKDFDEPGLSPDKIHNIYFMWTVRIPDKNDHLLKTANLSTMAGTADVPNTLTMPMAISGGPSYFDKGIFAQRLGVSFRNLDSGSSASGSSYNKITKSNLFEDHTKKYLKEMLANEPNIAGQVENNASNIFQFAKYQKNTSTTSTYSIPANVRALNGKVLVNVSVIVDAEYSVEIGENGETVKFRFPLGYVSGAKTKQFSSCSALATEAGKLINKDFNAMTPEEQKNALNIEGGTCEIEEWVEGAAIAKISALGNGDAMLDGTASYPPKSRKITYAYDLNTKDVMCEKDDKGNLVDPECKDKKVYNSMNQKVVSTTPWKIYTITGYYWMDKYRVKIDNSSDYEIDFKGKPYSSPNSVMYAKLNKGNTYACLGITTSAGKGYGAMGGNISGVSNKTTYQKTDTNFGKGGKSPLQIVDSGSYAYCDAIITEEQDRRIIENWGK